MSTTEPRPVSDDLAAMRARSARRIAEIASRPPGKKEPEPELADWEIEQIKTFQRYREEAAAARWEKIVPPRFHESQLSDFAESVVAQIQDWKAVAGDGANLVIFGAVGVGKSRIACAAIRKANENGMAIGFFPAGELLDEMRPGGSGECVSKVGALDVLVIDDLGVEKVTDWTSERMDLLINRRWLNQKPTIVTTNLEPEALAAHLGERAYSRLVGDGSVVLKLTGADRRRK